MDFSNLVPFYSDFSVAVTHTPLVGVPVTKQAIFDAPGTALIGGEMLATDYSLRYPVTTFQDVRRGDQFTVGGLTYTARESAQPASIDGLEHIVPLSKP